MMDDDVVGRSLRKVGKGAGMVLSGTALSRLLMLLFTVAAVRSLSMRDYGLFVLGLSITAWAVVLVEAGLPLTLVRYVGHFLGKGSRSSAESAAAFAFRTVLLLGLAGTVILWSASDAISILILGDTSLAWVLRYTAFIIPCLALLEVLISAFRGAGSAREKVYFQDVMRSVLLLSLGGALLFLGLTFTSFVAGYVVMIFLTFTAALVHSVRRMDVLHGASNLRDDSGRSMLSFTSWMMGGTVASMFMVNFIPVLLGFFQGAPAVAVYRVAEPLANLLPFVLMGVGYLFYPLASGLLSSGRSVELRRVYVVLTKWVFAFTLPLFLAMFMFPGEFLTLFYGERYVVSAPVLRLLILGTLLHSMLGPNMIYLTALGRPDLVTWNTAAAASVTVVGGVLLVPWAGVTGGAAAYAAGLVVVNALTSIQVYRLAGAHPFTRNLVLPSLLTAGVSGSAYLLPFHPGWGSSLPVLVVIVPLLYVLHLGSILLTRSMDPEDREVIRRGVNMLRGRMGGE